MPEGPERTITGGVVTVDIVRRGISLALLLQKVEGGSGGGEAEIRRSRREKVESNPLGAIAFRCFCVEDCLSGGVWMRCVVVDDSGLRGQN